MEQDNGGRSGNSNYRHGCPGHMHPFSELGSAIDGLMVCRCLLGVGVSSRDDGDIVAVASIHRAVGRLFKMSSTLLYLLLILLRFQFNLAAVERGPASAG